MLRVFYHPLFFFFLFSFLSSPSPFLLPAQHHPPFSEKKKKKRKRGLKVLSHALSPLLCVLSQHFSLSILCFCARPPSSCLCPGSLWSLRLSPALTLVPLSLTPSPCLSMALLGTVHWVLPLPLPWRWHHMRQEQAFLQHEKGYWDAAPVASLMTPGKGQHLPQAQPGFDLLWAALQPSSHLIPSVCLSLSLFPCLSPRYFRCNQNTLTFPFL